MTDKLDEAIEYFTNLLDQRRADILSPNSVLHIKPLIHHAKRAKEQEELIGELVLSSDLLLSQLKSIGVGQKSTGVCSLNKALERARKMGVE